MADSISWPNVGYDTSLPDLENALVYQQSLLQSTDKNYPKIFLLYDQEGFIYYLRYIHTKQLNDLEQAIASARSALHLLRSRVTEQYVNHHRATLFGHLSCYLIESLNYAENSERLEEALDLGRLALESLEKGSLQWWSVFIAQAAPFSESYSRTTNLETLDKVINSHRSVLGVEQIPDVLASSFFGILNALYGLKHKLTGNLKDLEEAIQFGYTAIEMLQYANVSYMEHSGLRTALLNHYHTANNFNSLLEALKVSRQGLELSMRSRQGPDDRAAALCNHGSLLYELSKRYQQTGLSEPEKAISALDDAIEYGNKALVMMENDRDFQVSIQNQLAAWHTAKMEITSDIHFGKQATDILERALQDRQPTHPGYLTLLDNLVHTWDMRYQISTSMKHGSAATTALNTAIEHGYKVVNLTLPTDPSVGTRTFNLAKILTKRYLLSEDPSTFREARDYFEKTVMTENAQPLFRIGSAIQASLFYWQDDLLKEAHGLLQEAISLLPRLNPKSISPQDLQLALSHISGLATLAAATSLEINQPPFEALMSLEQARCLIAGLSMSSNTDLSTLREIDSSLASRYDTLRMRLAGASRMIKSGEAYQEATRDQARLIKEIAQMEEQIRLLPGLESFQLPLTEESIKQLASEGPIIVVNASQIRCDAIVVTTNGIKHIPLKNMENQKLETYIGLWDRMGNESRRNAVVLNKRLATTKVSDAMLWLWNVAVQPILDNLEVTSSKRVWWITTGLAGRAPFHAAGNYSTGSRENTTSCVLSSYISSFKALQFARDRRKATATKLNMLLVTMSNNPYPHQNLNTSHEEQIVKEIFGTSMEHLSHPSPEAVLEKLPHYALVHFACHGSSISYNPSNSGLLLVKGGHAARLTITDLENVSLEAGSIAYLSACSTAEQADGKFADEAIHLANSFQVLGFQHVIGTMWGAQDAAAGEIARKVYQKLFLHANSETRDGRSGAPLNVARALHEAVIEYMEVVGRKNITCWAPFVHIGI